MRPVFVTNFLNYKANTNIVVYHFSRILFRTLNHQYDYTFDWTMLKQKSLQSGAVSAVAQSNAESRGDVRDKEKQQQQTGTELK